MGPSGSPVDAHGSSLAPDAPPKGDVVVHLRNAGKIFSYDFAQGCRYALRELAWPFRRAKLERTLRVAEFRALRDITLNVPRGEMLGVMGTSRSGKSTFARLIAGLYPQDEGVVEVHGRRLLAAGSSFGFRPMLEVRENVQFAAAMLGVPGARLGDVSSEILDFAEMDGSAHARLYEIAPEAIRRLRTALPLFGEAEVLVVDEALPTKGDAYSEKCRRRFAEFGTDRTSVIVSNNHDLLAQFADRVLVLHQGRCVALGKPEDAFAAFDRIDANGDNDEASASESPLESGSDDDSIDRDLAWLDPEQTSERRRRKVARKSLLAAVGRAPLTLIRCSADGEARVDQRPLLVTKRPGEPVSLECEFAVHGDWQLGDMIVSLHVPSVAGPIAERTLKLSEISEEQRISGPVAQQARFEISLELLTPRLRKGLYGIRIRFPVDNRPTSKRNAHKIAMLAILEGDRDVDDLSIEIVNATARLIAPLAPTLPGEA